MKIESNKNVFSSLGFGRELGEKERALLCVVLLTCYTYIYYKIFSSHAFDNHLNLGQSWSMALGRFVGEKSKRE